MTLPDDERSRPEANRAASDDLLAGGISSDSRTDRALIVSSAWQRLTGLLLSSPTVETARSLRDEMPKSPKDPVIAWWLNGIDLCLDALMTPNPMSAANAALNAGREAPAALRGQLVSAGWEMVSGAVSLPMACAHDFVAIVRDGAIREASDRAISTMSRAVWLGDLGELAEIVQREAGLIMGLLAEVNV